MRIIPGFLFAVLASAAITAERVDTLPEVLEAHRNALGAPLQSLQVDLAIEEAGFTVTARYLASRQPAMRIDVYADGERVFSEGLAGEDAWQWPGGEGLPSPASKAGKGALLRGITANLYGLHERPGLGYELSYEGVEAHDGESYWKVMSIAPGGFEEAFFVNVDTGLIERKEEWSALHPDVDATQRRSITRYRDYRQRGGRWLSFAAEKHDADSGEVLQRVTLTSAIVNPAISDHAFTMPRD